MIDGLHGKSKKHFMAASLIFHANIGLSFFVSHFSGLDFGSNNSAH
jgi:hypothetical protein